MGAQRYGPSSAYFIAGPAGGLPCPTASHFEVAIDPKADQSRTKPGKHQVISYDCSKIR